MYLPMNEYHFNRYFIERKTFLSLCKQFENDSDRLRKAHEETNKTEIDPNLLANLESHEETSWNALRSYMECSSENELIERYRQEQDDYRETIATWQRYGSAVFQFKDNLTEMLFNTEVNHIPASVFRCPYKALYIHIGNEMFIQNINNKYSVDGMYIVSDYYEDELLHSIKMAKDHHKWILGLTPEQKKYLIERHEHLGYVTDINELLDIGATSKRIQEAQKKLNDFRANFEHYDYSYINEINGTKSYHDYLCLYIIFTFRIKGKPVEELSPSKICSEPFLKAEYIFNTHRSTVSEAINQAFKRGFSKDTYLDNNRSEENILNVINQPRYLDDVSRLIFNLLCYLSWKDRDIVIRYPNQKLQDKIDNSRTKKERLRNISKTESQGYRKIHFCGFQTKYPRETLSDSTDITIKPHWRRGHWRNQACGPKLCDHKLLWIHPTIVNLEKDTDPPSKTTLYSV